MKTTKTNFIFFIFLLFTHAIQAVNLTMQITNSTNYPCIFKDTSNNTTIHFNIGETKNYTFISSPVSYTFGPSATGITLGYQDGPSIYYDSVQNSLTAGFDSSGITYNKTNYYGGTGFQLNLDGFVLNPGASVAGTFNSAIPYQQYYTATTVPPYANFSLSPTGQILQNIAYGLKNNSNSTSTNLTFYDYINTPLSSGEIPAQGMLSIPSGATSYAYINQSLGSSTVLAPVSSNASYNQFAAGSVNNFTTSTLNFRYYGPINNNLNSVLTYFELISPTENKPTITGMTSIIVYNSAYQQIISKSIDPNLNWYITNTNGIWDITSTQPANTAIITNNTGYTCNLIEGSKTTTFENGETKHYTFASSFSSYTFGPNVSPITISGQSGNILYNPSTNTLYATAGSNYSWENQTNISGGTGFQIYVIDTTKNILNINQSISGIIPYTAGAQPYTSQTNTQIPASATFTLNTSTGAIEINATYEQKTLLNNYNKATATIYFTNGSTGNTSSINAISQWQSIDVPTSTSSVYCTGLANGGNFTLDPNAVETIYTNSVITNNTNDQIWLQCTTTTGGNYIIYPGQSLPIVSGVIDITLFVNQISKGYTTITPNTSYLITYTEPNYFITPYTPLLNNNYTNQITSLNFYNSNNQLNSTVSFLDSNQTYPTPTNTSFATFQIPNISTSTTFTMPITFPELLNISTGNTITNSSGYNVQVNYYGNYNTNNDTLLTSAPLGMTNDQIIPITTGALNAQILDESGTQVIAEINGALHPGIDYYILYNAGTWTLSSTPSGSTYYLINNFNQSTGPITFYNSSSQVTGTTSGIAAYDSYPIPATTTKISCSGLVNGSSCDIEITENTNTNIYTNYALTNNTNYDIVATYYGSITSNTVINGTVTIPARTSANNPTFVPIVTSTTKISIAQASNPVIEEQAIVNNSSYIVNFNNPLWSLTSYTPTLQNNSSENGTNLTFYDITGSAIPSNVSGNFTALNNAPVPINATTVGMYIYGSTITIPTTLAAQSYVFTNNTITNLANQTANITFYSNTINGSTPTLNNPEIAVQATANLPRITSGTSILVSSGEETVIAQTSIEDNTSYFINYDPQTNTWWLSVNVPTQNELLTNNYTQNATNLQFYTSDLNPLGTLTSTFEAWSSTVIPTNASYAKLIDLNSNIQLYTTPNNSVNLFTGFVIKNNSTQDIVLWFYDTANNHVALNPGILTEPNISTPIITYTNTVAVTNAVYVDGVPTEIYIPATPIVSNSSYYVMYDETTDTWSLVQTLPTENSYLTNNYDGTATNLAFFNANNTQQGTTQQTMSAHTSTLIPTTSTKAKLAYFNSNITIEINDTTSTGIFTNNYLINNAGQTISAIYYGSSQQPITDPISSTYASNNMPIITSAAYFSIFDSNGIEQISQQPITVGTDYIIDNTWTITPITPARLTNNSGQDAVNLIFYNVNTPVGTTINPFYNQTAVDIPTNATIATTTQTFNSINSTLTVSANDSVSSNLVTEYKLHNNSGSTVTVVFKGIINNNPNQPLNSPTISMPGFSLISILTGAQLVSVYLDNSLVITDAQIDANTTYYINYINNVWSLDTYASIVNIVNNSSTDASHLIFYDADNTNISTDNSFNAYSTQPIPTTAIYAQADFESPFSSTLTIPVTSAATCPFFNTTHCTVSNDTSAVIQDIGIIFYGTINTISNCVLNDPTIVISANESVPVLSGPESFSVVDPTNNSIIYIANYPIDANESYAVTNYYDENNSLIWTVNETVYTATLTNNYNQEGTNLKFFNSTTTFDSSTQVGTTQSTFPAYSSTGIPTHGLTAQFDIFNSTLTFPVSETASSTVYAHMLYNKTGETIYVTYYGTVGGVANTPLNNPEISCANGETIPFLAATDYMIITAGSNSLDTRTTTYNPLPKTLAYDIVYNPSLNIIPHQLNLTNNFYQTANSISFYTSQGTFISTINNVMPFATVTIPSSPQATSAVIVYDNYTVTIPLSISTSSQVLRNNILTNNSNDDVTIIFSDKQGNSLNTEPIVLVTGAFIPFITGTEQVTVLVNDAVIIANENVISTESYRIQQQNNFQQRLVRAENDTPELTTASSALGVIRMLGGSVSSQSGIIPVEVYGNNINLFKEFLYIDVYAKVITDSTARTAAIRAVNTVVDTYAQNNSGNNFNYVAYLYQINDELRIAQALLRSQYPNSIQQIDLFFRYIIKRNTKILVQ